MDPAGGGGGTANGGNGGNGGTGTSNGGNGSNGGFGGGGGGGGEGPPLNNITGGHGGNGGDFGGGGGGVGGSNDIYSPPGSGGFGGGGGSDPNGIGGTGGFGGGGGSRAFGGFGGGDGGFLTGGGGAALGANVFVRGDNGASLTLRDSSTSAGTLTAGTGGGNLAGDGSTDGSSVFSTGGTLHATVDSGHSETLAGSIAQSGSVSLLKDGGGTLSLTGGNGCAGGTHIAAGTLLADNLTGSATGKGSVMVDSGATLGGTGSISGPVNLSGTLAPGDPSVNGGVGTLAIGGDLSMGAGSSLSYLLGSTANSDRVTVGGNLALAGSLDVTALAGFGAGTYDLIDYSGMVSGTLGLGTLPSGFDYRITEGGGHVDLVVSAAGAVPEPGSLVLLATGMTLAVAAGCRRARTTVTRGKH